jgi:hypothetical protein
MRIGLKEIVSMFRSCLKARHRAATGAVIGGPMLKDDGWLRVLAAWERDADGEGGGGTDWLGIRPRRDGHEVATTTFTGFITNEGDGLDAFMDHVLGKTEQRSG